MKKTVVDSLICMTMTLLIGNTIVGCKARRDKSAVASVSDKTYRFGRDELELKPFSGPAPNVLKSYKLCHIATKKCINPFQFSVEDGFKRLTLEQTSFQEYEDFQRAFAQLQVVVETYYASYAKEYTLRDKPVQDLDRELKDTQVRMNEQIGAIKLERKTAKAFFDTRKGFTKDLKARIPSILEAFKKQIVDRPGQLEAIKQQASTSYNIAQEAFRKFVAASQVGITTEEDFSDSIMYSSGPVSTYVHKDDNGKESNFCQCNNTGELFAFEGTEYPIYEYYTQKYGSYPFTRGGKRPYSCEDYILPPPVCRIPNRDSWGAHMTVLKHQMAALNPRRSNPGKEQ